MRSPILSPVAPLAPPKRVEDTAPTPALKGGCSCWHTLRLAHHALHEVLPTVTAESCPDTLNLHLHTVYSDGRMQPEDTIRQAMAAKVKHIAITDHHSVAGYRLARRFLQGQGGGGLPTLWVGVEINASLLFSEVHILGYGFDPDHAAVQPYLQGKTTAGVEYQACNVITALHRAGGLAVLAHPARYRRSPEELIAEAASLGIDGIETYYGYDHCDPWRPSPRQTEQVRAIGDRLGLWHTCGTDAHGLKISRRL